ncbi:hypothetical protein [Kordiimonas sp. SCSIO 12610]|uniref:hypothetical protein n=1 Tax=Kordiimonas sp. SCSIO 12610 TaxID=2829597 RepID=UPI00210C2BF8|nr:hypothetical protein [Kordiimonas sp. SCSIO 12610]UTW54604.1 hypothetical protein KFF44_12440 [Kordiimonas sp. SCSIO 12610]
MLQETIPFDHDDQYLVLGNSCLGTGGQPQPIVKTYKSYISSAQCHPFTQVIESFDPEENGLLLQHDGLTYRDIQALQLTDGLLIFWADNKVFLKNVQADVTDEWLYIDAGSVTDQALDIVDMNINSLSGYTVTSRDLADESAVLSHVEKIGCDQPLSLQSKLLSDCVINQKVSSQTEQPASYLDLYNDAKYAGCR